MLRAEVQGRTEEIMKQPKILIVDDDVDSALQVRTLFSRLGCETICALDGNEAKHQICALDPDVIILDWILGRHADALDVVKACGRTLAKFEDQNSKIWHKPKIITFSSLDSSEIEFLNSPFFEHLEHWKKPATQRDLLNRALGLLGRMRR